MNGAFHHRAVRLLAFLLVVLKLWFVSAEPMVISAGAGHDDRLFFERADDLVHGRWLGEYSQFTLMKGAGYPLLIAGSFRAGIPLPIAENVLYLLGCWLVVRALRPRLRNDGWAVATFALLAWQPMSFTVSPPGFGIGSVIRQNLYTPLTLLIFAGLAGLYTRRNAPGHVRAGWALLLGLGSGWFWITREESVWIFPSVALLAGALAVITWRERLPVWRAVWPLALAVLGGVAPVATVSALNARHYGWFGTVEFHAPQFIAAYGALTRVKVGEPLDRVPVTRAARQAIYPVSPAFSELRELLEGELTRRWAGGDGREINGGMWMWVLRDAVRESGHAPTAAAALAFYQRIADEVNAACDAGRLPAAPRRDTFLPLWNEHYGEVIRSDLFRYPLVFFRFEGFRARPSASTGDVALLEIFRDLGQWPVSRSPEAPELALPRSDKARAWRIGALQDIGTVLCGVCRWLIPVGAVAWLLALLVNACRRCWPGYGWWFSSACLGGALAVVAISLLVHVTSWPDTRPLRFAEAYPLILLFAAVAIVDLVDAVVRARAAFASAPSTAVDA